MSYLKLRFPSVVFFLVFVPGLNALQAQVLVHEEPRHVPVFKNKEIRNQNYEWFTGDVIPVGDKNTKMIVIGNLLHEDSLMMKLKTGVANGTLQGKFYSYPLVLQNGDISWPGKYPTLKAIEDERKRIGNDIAWFREYLLQILPPEDRIIKNDWIRYYDELPANLEANCTGYVISLDPAISQNQNALGRCGGAI
jgi:hypothetical protein